MRLSRELLRVTRDAKFFRRHMFWPDILRLATLADRPAKLAKSAIFLYKIFFFDKKS